MSATPPGPDRSTDQPESPTIGGLILERASEGGGGLVFEDRRWSWSEVVAESAARAGLLEELRGEGPFHVGVLLENVPEYVFLLFGAALAGATVVGINPTRRGEALAEDIRHTDCAAVITDPAGAALLSGLDLGPAGDAVVDIDGPDYAGRLARHAGAPLPDRAGLPGPGHLYLLLFTSGSTGSPKAVRMTTGRAARTAADSAVAFGPSDVLYCAMPLFHGNALLANLLAGLVSGATVVLRRRFSASGFLPDVRRYGCTFFNYVGRALSYILAVPETPEDADNQLKWALGSEASPQNRAEFTRRFRCPIFEGYGSSENAVVISPAGRMPPGALGKPRAGMDVTVVDPGTGRERAVAVLDGEGRLTNPTEAIGEIVGRNTADRFEGYYNNPEAEAERLRGGWYWTGDLGYRDADGVFYFAGRTADWLRVDGENFSAGAVERVLNRFPGASAAAVYGVPDPVTGDQVMAAVEMEPGTTFDPDAFAAFLAGAPDLGTKWAPRFVRVVEELPVTATRKVEKAALRRQAWRTSDPLFWRADPADPGYAPMGPGEVEEWEGRFAENQRGHLVPADAS